MSPYITSSTAETILLSNCELNSKIYTCFKAENFVQQASSLSTLKKLLLNHCKLFHIADLHAKVMLTDNFISIGSQNLTNKGRINKESTFCSSEPQYISYGRKAIESWTLDAEEITIDMVEKMELLIAPYIKDYIDIKNNLTTIDEEIERQLKSQNIKTYQEWQDIIQNNLSYINISENHIFASVKQLIKRNSWGGITITSSLVPMEKDDNLCIWCLSSTNVSMQSKLRYLIFDTETSKIGWARINKTRITYFCNGISSYESLSLNGKVFHVEYAANWTDTRNEYNLILYITFKETDLKLVYKCFFDLAFLNNIRLDMDESSKGANLSEEHLWNLNNKIEFQTCLAEQLLSPFKYKKALIGEQANKFFKSSNSHWKKISLATVNEFNFLVSEPYID